MDLWFLGTGAGQPSRDRNVTSIALTWFQERGTFWLFDCGEATQHQIQRSPLTLAKLEKVFLTHLHGDHLFGLPSILGSRSFSGTTLPLQVFGPKGLMAYIDAMLSASQTHLTYPLEVVEIVPGRVFKDAMCTVTCQKLDHTIESFGYRIIEEDAPGSLDTDALRQAGLPPGPLYGQLKRGEPVRLADGTVLRPANFIGPVQRGRIVTILGDTRPTPAATSLAQDADVLVHEATFAETEAQLAPSYGHSTASDAARVAHTANAHLLVLTHISARYSGQASGQLLAEAQDIFPATRLAYDLLEVNVPKPPAGDK